MADFAGIADDVVSFYADATANSDQPVNSAPPASGYPVTGAPASSVVPKTNYTPYIIGGGVLIAIVLIVALAKK